MADATADARNTLDLPSRQLYQSLSSRSARPMQAADTCQSKDHRVVEGYTQRLLCTKRLNRMRLCVSLSLSLSLSLFVHTYIHHVHIYLYVASINLFENTSVYTDIVMYS